MLIIKKNEQENEQRNFKLYNNNNNFPYDTSDKNPKSNFTTIQSSNNNKYISERSNGIKNNFLGNSHKNPEILR